MKRKTNEEFVNEVFALTNGAYEVLSEYKNAITKVRFIHHCISCNNFRFEMTPNDFLMGKRCSKCSGVYRRTHKEFVSEVESIFGKDTYEFLGSFKNIKSPITTKHLKCGYTWNPIASILIDKKKSKPPCPYCNWGSKILNTDSFKDLIFNIVKNEYEVLGEYINSDTKVKMRHVTCGHIYDVSPYCFIHMNNRCPNCFGGVRKTQNEFEEKIYEIVGDEYIVLGNYINYHTKILMKHNIDGCNRIFEVSPSSFIRGNTRCSCGKFSKGEYKIGKILQSNNIKYSSQYMFDDCKNVNSLRFDFAIFDKNNTLKYLIEYDGEQHFRSVEYWGGDDYFNYTKLNDQIKNNYCKEKSIGLYRIPYWKFNEIEEILNKLIKNQSVEIDGNLLVL